jgi:hypothetical protein
VHDAGRLLEFDADVAPRVRRLLELTHTDRLIAAGGTQSV